MADSRRREVYAPPRDTGLPRSPPVTPAVADAAGGDPDDEVRFASHHGYLEDELELFRRSLSDRAVSRRPLGEVETIGGLCDTNGARAKSPAMSRRPADVTSQAAGRTCRQAKAGDTSAAEASRSRASGGLGEADSTGLRGGSQTAGRSLDHKIASEQQRIDMKIRKLEDKLKTLSAQRRVTVRHDIREMLSDDSSRPCDNDHSLRTANKSKGGWREVALPQRWTLKQPE